MVILLKRNRKGNGGYIVKMLRTFFIDEITEERLNTLSAITKIPKAVLIREGIDLMFDKYEKKLKEFYTVCCTANYDRKFKNNRVTLFRF